MYMYKLDIYSFVILFLIKKKKLESLLLYFGWE